MKILLINDDGIDSPGLWAAARALRKVGEVVIVAPAEEQSGVGASLTLHRALQIGDRELTEEFQSNGNGLHPVTAYTADGTPGDCCILALETLVGKVDLVVSGINSGSNVGWDVMVSGTVGGAVQGFVRGYPTIAISVASVRDPKYDIAERLLELLGARIQEKPDPSLFLNVNIPNVPLGKVSGVRVTRLGNRSYGESVRPEGAAASRLYKIRRDRPSNGHTAEDTDIWAVKNSCVSITPLRIGMGNDEMIADVESLLDGLPHELLPRPD